MEKTILSKKNCHRASLVQSINNPEWGTWAFNYKEQELPNRQFNHTIGTGAQSRVLDEEEFAGWEVVDWKYDVSLEEYWDMASRAYMWTSFNPDRAGERTIIGHEKELNSDLENIPTGEQARYIDGYKKHFTAWLSAHSNCASSAITGGSGFNVSRAQKANDREHNRMQDFINWRERALAAIARNVKRNKPEEEKQAEEWMQFSKDINHYIASIVDIVKNKGFGSKSAYVALLYGKIERVANNGNVDFVNRAIAEIRAVNANPKYCVIVTERHKLFKLPELAEKAAERLEAKANKEDAKISFEGGTVVKNYSEDRLQILFDTKPATDVIAKLKSSGFRWSPRFTAWQRQLTTNAYVAATRVIPVTYEQLIQLK